jgi:trans-aconitate methyltransferase
MKQSKKDSVNQPFLPSSTKTPNNPPADFQHRPFHLTVDGALFLSPVIKLHNTLDIATGTGIQVIKIAQEHSEARVIGTDLSPIEPSYIPPNCRFYIEDCEDPSNFSPKFDMTHGRALLSCFSKPRTAMASIFDVLTPGVISSCGTFVSVQES